MSTYGKSIFAFLGLLAVACINYFAGDQRIDNVEATQIVVAAATLATTWLVPLTPKYPWIKTVVALIGTLAGVAVTLIGDGFDATDSAVLIAQALAFFGISAAPAFSPKTQVSVDWGTDSRSVTA